MPKRQKVSSPPTRTYFPLKRESLGITSWNARSVQPPGRTSRERSTKKNRRRTKVSFDDCVIHHLLTVFPLTDAAEQQKYYISNVLKKPQRVSVRAFFTRVEQLNNYVKLLPGVYNSPQSGTCNETS